jgi:KipI family sensor histidine kinase inhibitor
VAEWVPLGDRAIRFARAAVSSRAIVREVRRWPGVVDVVVSRDDVAAYFDRAPHVDPERIRALATAIDDPEPVRDIELRAAYDGPDLDDVARATGITTDEVKRLHATAIYTVETMGFAPGFAYLTGLDARLVLPRRATPRPRVPAGSIGLAGAYTAVYPFDSPGGWHLVGHVVGVTMFDSDGPLLRLGDRVRFVS